MKEVKFGELYKIPSSNGLSRPSRVRGEGYPMINMGELFSYDIIGNVDMELVPMSEKECGKYFVEDGDLLFARQSLVAEGAGKCSIIQGVGNATTFESHLIRVRLDDEKCNPWFYYYLFKLPDNPIKTIVNQCAQAGIRGTELVKIKVPMYSLEIQNRIVDVLKPYDDLLLVNKKRINDLHRIADSIYREFFVRFRDFESEKKNWKNSPIGKIPQAFTFVKMQDVFEYYIGGGWGEEEYNEEFSEEAYVIRGTDFPLVTDGDIGSCPLRYHKTSNYKSRKIKENDILIEVSGGTAEQPVGRTVLIEDDILEVFGDRVICASFCKLIRLDSSKISPLYFYYWMQFLYETRIIEKYQLQSTGIINFKFDYFLRKGDLMVPPKEIMDRFDELIRPIHKEIHNITKQNKNLEMQRNILMPKLISGVVDVR